MRKSGHSREYGNEHKILAIEKRETHRKRCSSFLFFLNINAMQISHNNSFKTEKFQHFYDIECTFCASRISKISRANCTSKKEKKNERR